jgi:hypothetical protein
LFCFYAYIYDSLKRKKELARIAYVDEITGGDPYAKFCISVRKILENNPETLAILNINIDGFKFFNIYSDMKKAIR